MVELRLFEVGDADAFRALNEAWIEKLFTLEEHDREILNDPGKHILEPGGRIIVAVDGNRVVGCCGLMPMEPGVFEVAKMAVDEEYQGRGVGRKVLARTIEEGRALVRRSCTWRRNHRLENAIHLYESLGSSTCRRRIRCMRGRMCLWRYGFSGDCYWLGGCVA